MTYQLVPHIQTPEDLGVAVLGNPHTSMIPAFHENRIDRAECGRRIAELEGGMFTPHGYVRPMEDKETTDAA